MYYTISLIIHAVLFVFPGGNTNSQGCAEVHHLYRRDNTAKSNTNRLHCHACKPQSHQRQTRMSLELNKCI